MPNGFGSGTSSYFVFTNFQIAYQPQPAPPPPRCACGQIAEHRTEKNELLCRRCVIIVSAHLWLEAAFTACSTTEQRQKLYRQLAAIYHPDVAGGDDRVMRALNGVKDDLSAKGAF
jgi:hypothetical protein